MFIVTVDLTIHPDHIEDYAAVIARQARTSVAEEPGCHRFDVYRHESDPQRFFLHEIYEDRAAFEAHTKMPHSLESGATTKPWIAKADIGFWHAGN
jgi:autoinducer 2-degrading protein